MVSLPMWAAMISGVSPVELASLDRRSPQKFLDDRHAAVPCGQRQRRNAEISREIDVRAAADQQVDGLEMCPVGRPRERRRAIGLASVDVDALVDEAAGGGPILMLDGVDQAEIVRCAATVVAAARHAQAISPRMCMLEPGNAPAFRHSRLQNDDT